MFVEQSLPGRAGLQSLPFLWGAGTSAHQVEGANDDNDWSAWERAPGSPCAEPSGSACEHRLHYAQDMALLRQLGLNSYRFSVEWSRVEPQPGRFEGRWLKHYRNMARTCRELGLLAIVTLHHFTNPLWLSARGGWEHPDAARRFAHYCGVVSEALAADCAAVITINEPNIPALLGYEVGVFPPGRRDRTARLRASQVFIDGHRRAVQAVRAAAPALPVGLALAMADWQALPGGERELAQMRRLREDIFLEATTGDDFVGVNTYTRHRIGPQGWMGNEPGVELTAAGYEFWPQALEATLRRAWEVTGGTPLIATETGVATDDDRRRVEFIERSVQALNRAMRAGVDVRGYLAWSALDNFEWQHGYAQRFGLIAVDRATQVRTVKPSAWRLGEIAAAARPGAWSPGAAGSRRD